MPGVGLVLLEVEDVTMAVVPVEIIIPVFQGVGIETVRLLVERALGVGAGEKTVRAGGIEAMVFGNVSALRLAAGSRASALAPKVLDSGNRHPIAQGIERAHRVVVHVPTSAVKDLRDRVKRDVPQPGGQPQVVPEGAIHPGDSAAHGVAVVIELPDRIGQLEPVQNHRGRLSAPDVVPVEQRPAFLLGTPPLGSRAVEQRGQIRVIGGSVRDDLEVADPRGGAVAGQESGEGKSEGQPPEKTFLGLHDPRV